LPRWAWM